jgi:hypothetical protein
VVEHRPGGGRRRLQRLELRRTGDATPAAAGQRIPQPSGGRAVWGQVAGVVTKRAARVRVLFDMGISPLDLVPLEVGHRFPVNFYAGFYQQPRKDERPCTWQVVRVLGFDKWVRKVAER